MGKILFWAVVAALAWGAWSMIRLSQRRRDRAAPPPGEREPERIVACSRCGVHLPASDALRGGGQWYCCAEHRDGGRH
jgi:uncharacterized protein